MHLIRSASAVWKGSGMDGSGTLSSASGVLTDAPYSFHTRFQDQPGTNPEELIAAAHAGCYSMALSFMLSGAGHPPAELATSAKVRMVKEGTGWTIESITLSVVGTVPGIDAATFAEHAAKAKASCPVSRALASVAIELEAELAGG